MDTQIVGQYLPQNQHQISNSMTIFGLLNGMIGSTILILPLIGIETGYITALIVCLGTGGVCYYTGNLIVVHLGKAKNMKESILYHFDQNYRYMFAYAFVIWCSEIPILALYYNLICLQIEGLIGQQVWISTFVFITLLIGTILVLYYDYGEETMGIGVLSIVAALLFITWSHFTAPAGEKTVPAFGDPYMMLSSLILGYSVHDFLAQNIIKNPNKKNYKSIVFMTFVLGTFVYTYIAQSSFAFVNRVSFHKNPATINDFFEVGSIEIGVIELLYLLHIATVFPQHVRVSKIRFFDMLQIKTTTKTLQLKHGFYTFVLISGCFLINYFNVSLKDLITINGALFSNMIVIMIPIILHIKCTFIDKNSGSIEGEEQLNHSLTNNICECDYKYSYGFMKWVEIVFDVLLFGFGVYFLIDSLGKLGTEN